MQSCTLATPYNRPTNYSPSPLLCFAQPQEDCTTQAENPQSGSLGSKGNGIAKNSTNIDWRTSFLIKVTLGLWFWGTWSTNFPNQADVLAFLPGVPRSSTKDFIFSVIDTCLQLHQVSFPLWFLMMNDAYWDPMSQISIPKTLPGKTSVSKGAAPYPTYTGCLLCLHVPP